MTTTALATPWALIADAIQHRRPIHITYHARRRLVCPHALGWHNDRPVVLGYQTGGDTSTGTLDPDPRKRWRVMHIDQIDDVTPGDHTDRWGTADNYNPVNPFPFAAHIATTISA